MQGNLAGRAPTCPAGPATAYRWDSLYGSARVNHDATAGFWCVARGQAGFGMGLGLCAKWGTKNAGRRLLRFCSL